MSKQASRKVSVASCHSPAEAMMIKTVFEAHGIGVIIPGAGSSSVTAAATGFSSVVLVDEEDVEEATALIAELRREPALLVDGRSAEDDEDEDEDGANDEAGAGGRPVQALTDVGRALAERRKKLVATLCLSLMVTFGTGHFLHRAWGRGVVLAVLETLGIAYAVVGLGYGDIMIAGAILLDLLGSMQLLRSRYPVVRPTALPGAKTLPKGR